jgi:hypothetical protein
MTPERIARLVAWWARLYTRGLPEAAARRRVDELDADVHDQIEHERAAGTGDRRIALAVLSRMARGLPADALWRRRVRTRPGGLMKFVLALLILALGLVTMNYAQADDAPGLGLIGILLIVGAIVLGKRSLQRR